MSNDQNTSAKKPAVDDVLTEFDKALEKTKPTKERNKEELTSDQVNQLLQFVSEDGFRTLSNESAGTTSALSQFQVEELFGKNPLETDSFTKLSASSRQECAEAIHLMITWFQKHQGEPNLLSRIKTILSKSHS